jgi:hypothetical protein
MSALPIDLLWLLCIICSASRPFVATAYNLQQHYLPYKPQISCLLVCCCLLMVATILWQNVFCIPETTIESGNV